MQHTCSSTHFKQLLHLTLPECKVDSAALNFLAGVGQLASLSLHLAHVLTPLSENMVRTLTSFKTITSLSLLINQPEEVSLRELSVLQQLQSLTLTFHHNSGFCSPLDLHHALHELPALTHLTLSGCDVRV